MMRAAARRRTLERMSQAGESGNLKTERIREWQDASDRALHAYRAWCAATRGDRHGLYMSLLNALRREERAAWRADPAAPGQGAVALGRALQPRAVRTSPPMCGSVLVVDDAPGFPSLANYRLTETGLTVVTEALDAEEIVGKRLSTSTGLRARGAYPGMRLW